MTHGPLPMHPFFSPLPPTHTPVLRSFAQVINRSSIGETTSIIIIFFHLLFTFFFIKRCEVSSGPRTDLSSFGSLLYLRREGRGRQAFLIFFIFPPSPMPFLCLRLLGQQSKSIIVFIYFFKDEGGSEKKNIYMYMLIVTFFIHSLHAAPPPLPSRRQGTTK